MAEEKLQYTLTLSTRATGTGAKDTVADLAKVAAATKVVAEQSGGAQDGIRKLSNESKTGGNQLGKMGQLANQASFQIGDFFTQVEMGTSATRAFSQQAPQLLGALSSAGMMSAKAAMMFSGIGAAIPLLTMALPPLIEGFIGAGKASGEAAGKITEDAMKAAERLGEINTQRIEDENERIRQATDDSILLSKQYGEADAAQNKATIAALDNAEKLRVAHNQVAESLGLQVSKYEEIAAAAAADAAKRKETTAQDIEGEKGRLNEAAKQVWAVGQRQGDKEVALRARKAELDAARETLKVLREQEIELTKMSHISVGFFDAAGSENKAKAAKDLENLQPQLVSLENDVASAEAALKKAQNEAASTRAGFDDAIKMVGDVSTAVSDQVATLEKNLAADDTAARVKATAETEKAQAETVKGLLDDIAPQTAAQQAALDSLRQITADGKVTGNESDALMKNMRELMGGLQSGMSETNQNVGTMIQMMQQTVVQQGAYKAELARLWQELKRQGATGSTPLPQR